MFFNMIGVTDNTTNRKIKCMDIVKERNIQFAIAMQYKDQVNRSLAEDLLKGTSQLSHKD